MFVLKGNVLTPVLRSQHRCLTTGNRPSNWQHTGMREKYVEIADSGVGLLQHVVRTPSVAMSENVCWYLAVLRLMRSGSVTERAIN